MHVIENNQFKFQFEFEIGEIGRTENVTLCTLDAFRKTGVGEVWIGHTHLEPQETWEFANWLSHGQLNYMREMIDKHNRKVLNDLPGA